MKVWVLVARKGTEKKSPCLNKFSNEVLEHFLEMTLYWTIIPKKKEKILILNKRNTRTNYQASVHNRVYLLSISQNLARLEHLVFTL